MGVQGFPTLKIVKPSSKIGKPIVEDYQGPRTAKGIVDAVIDKIPNLVTKVEDKSLEAFMAEGNDTAKAILFTEKGTTTALIKAVAIEFKGGISIAQIRNTQKASVELFGITRFPTLLLLPGGASEGIIYDGELRKDAIVAFLSQVTTPNPDPAPAKIKLPKSKPKKPERVSKAKESMKSSSASQTSTSEKTATIKSTTTTEETVHSEATGSSSPQVEEEKPSVAEPQPATPISLLATEDVLRNECLGPKTGTCILAILPREPDEIAGLAVGVLSEIAHRGKTLKYNLFPFYVVPEHNPGYSLLTEKLGLGGKTEVVAINARRGWYCKLPLSNSDITAADVAEDVMFDWVESIKLGDGVRSKLPAGLVIEEVMVEDLEFIEEPAAQEPLAEQAITVEQVIRGAESEIETRTEQGESTTVTAVVEEVKTDKDKHDEL
jgi:protein disulfide-isomerase A6